MNKTETSTDFLLGVAHEAIALRAAQDHEYLPPYDAEHDPEGYICSLLNALHHWCHRHGIDWDAELCRANDCFSQDMLEPTGETPTETRPKIEELQCPECGHRDSFLIEVTEYLLMFSDYMELSGGQGEQWGRNSSCICAECGHLGVVFQFQVGVQAKEMCHG